MNNGQQRLNLFKILQAREHVKFTNIQSEKMINFQNKMDEENEKRTQQHYDLQHLGTPLS